MTDEEQAAEEPIPAEPTPPTEIEITVAGHTVTVKATAPMGEVAAQALDLFERTRGAARRIPIGFDTNASQVELAPAVAYGGALQEWGAEEDHAGMGRQHT